MWETDNCPLKTLGSSFHNVKFLLGGSCQAKAYISLLLCLMGLKLGLNSIMLLKVMCISSRLAHLSMGLHSPSFPHLLGWLQNGRAIRWRSLDPWITAVAAAAAKLLQSCLTLGDPIDSSPPGSPVPGILQARTLEWGAIAFSALNHYVEKSHPPSKDYPE